MSPASSTSPRVPPCWTEQNGVTILAEVQDGAKAQLIVALEGPSTPWIDGPLRFAAPTAPLRGPPPSNGGRSNHGKGMHSPSLKKAVSSFQVSIPQPNEDWKGQVFHGHQLCAQ